MNKKHLWVIESLLKEGWIPAAPIAHFTRARARKVISELKRAIPSCKKTLRAKKYIPEK
jgi:hypothetical protein